MQLSNQNRPTSRDFFERACQLIPGGVNSPARAFGGVGGTPVFVDHAEGPYLYDVDGHRYIDFIGSWGPMILGHAHPAVRAALHAAVDQGSSYGAPTLRESELAAAIIDAVPSIGKVRLVSSGTEATMSAIRLARGYSGRKKIVKFAGNYHGHADALLVAAGSSAATLGVPNSPGVTPGAVQDTIVLNYNDVTGVQALFDREGSEIAAIIIEPVVGNMGCVVPSQVFLETVRRATQDAGALLIFDEVMTGFRLALGGAQELFGIAPDLTTLGKIVGGGLPLGAYGGRSDIMDHVLPAGKVFQAGTLSGNPLATAAGLATLSELKKSPPYLYLERITELLADGLGTAAMRAKVPHYITMVGSMITLFFTEEPVKDWPSAAKCNTERYAAFFHGMLDRGFYLPCSQYEAWFLSTAHTDTIIQETIQAAEEVLNELV
jgi:glutamate-1-semialdehyde 2,1-aminomutase